MGDIDKFIDNQITEEKPKQEIKQKPVFSNIFFAFIKKHTIVCSLIILSFASILLVNPFKLSVYLFTLIFVMLNFFSDAFAIYLLIMLFQEDTEFKNALYIAFVGIIIWIIYGAIGSLLLGLFLVFLYMSFLWGMLTYYIPKLTIPKFIFFLIINGIVYIVAFSIFYTFLSIIGIKILLY